MHAPYSCGYSHQILYREKLKACRHEKIHTQKGLMCMKTSAFRILQSKLKSTRTSRRKLPHLFLCLYRFIHNAKVCGSPHWSIHFPYSCTNIPSEASGVIPSPPASSRPNPDLRGTAFQTRPTEAQPDHDVNVAQLVRTEPPRVVQERLAEVVAPHAIVHTVRSDADPHALRLEHRQNSADTRVHNAETVLQRSSVLIRAMVRAALHESIQHKAMKTADKDGGVVNGAGKALLLLCVIGFPEEAQKQKQVGGVNKCGHSEPPPPSARPPTPEPDVRDQARKARDKLDDLASGDHLLPRKGDLEQGGSIVGVHHDVDQGVEPH
ncbi:unnamed protein product, partial [Chondrus crispus]